MNSLQIEEPDYDSQSGVGSMCYQDRVMSKSNYLQLFDDFTLARFAFELLKRARSNFQSRYLTARFFLA